jgi:hypothetical protein
LRASYPDAELVCDADRARATLRLPPLPETMEIDVWVRPPGANGMVRWRVNAINEGTPHYWMHIRGAQRESLYSTCTCSFDQIQALWALWVMPPTQPVRPLALPPADAAMTLPPAPATATLENAVDETPLRALPDGDASCHALRDDVACIDLATVLQHWPRDAQGRLAVKTAVLLRGYGPPMRKRQPCLLITSPATQAQMRSSPVWKISISMEFLWNHKYQWSAAPWRWRAQPAPPENPDIARARQWLQQGRIEDACRSFGVALDDSVCRAAQGLPLQRFMGTPPVWRDELRAALHQLAPWRIPAAVQRVQDYLAAANRKAPKIGSWERKLFWFSGQRQQCKWGLLVEQGSDDAPRLKIAATSSNEYLPEADWRQ